MSTDNDNRHDKMDRLVGSSEGLTHLHKGKETRKAKNRRSLP